MWSHHPEATRPTYRLKPRRASPRRAVRSGFCSGLATVILHTLQHGTARAEDHLDYKYENYGEEDGRIQVQTHSALFEAALTHAVTARAQFVYDAISGATPTGG